MRIVLPSAPPLTIASPTNMDRPCSCQETYPTPPPTTTGFGITPTMDIRALILGILIGAVAAILITKLTK